MSSGPTRIEVRVVRVVRGRIVVRPWLIMTEKGLVERDERDRTHIYRARLSEEQTQRQLLRDLLDRAFGGSSTKLVMQALATRRASAEELRDIRKAIDGAKHEKEVRRERDDNDVRD